MNSPLPPSKKDRLKAAYFPNFPLFYIVWICKFFWLVEKKNAESDKQTKTVFRAFLKNAPSPIKIFFSHFSSKKDILKSMTNLKGVLKCAKAGVNFAE